MDPTNVRKTMVYYLEKSLTDNFIYFWDEIEEIIKKQKYDFYIFSSTTTYQLYLLYKKMDGITPVISDRVVPTTLYCKLANQKAYHKQKVLVITDFFIFFNEEYRVRKEIEKWIPIPQVQIDSISFIQHRSIHNDPVPIPEAILLYQNTPAIYAVSDAECARLTESILLLLQHFHMTPEVTSPQIILKLPIEKLFEKLDQESNFSYACIGNNEIHLDHFQAIDPTCYPKYRYYIFDLTDIRHAWILQHSALENELILTPCNFAPLTYDAAFMQPILEKLVPRPELASPLYPYALFEFLASYKYGIQLLEKLHLNASISLNTTWLAPYFGVLDQDIILLKRICEQGLQDLTIQYENQSNLTDDSCEEDFFKDFQKKLEDTQVLEPFKQDPNEACLLYYFQTFYAHYIALQDGANPFSLTSYLQRFKQFLNDLGTEFSVQNQLTLLLITIDAYDLSYDIFTGKFYHSKRLYNPFAAYMGTYWGREFDNKDFYDL